MASTKRTAVRCTTGDVFIVHGRNLEAKHQLVAFLESLRLNPLDFDQVRQKADATATVLEVVRLGLMTCQLVIALFTPDEWSVLRGDLRKAEEEEWNHRRWQARPNVVFEAGFAFGLDPSRVISIVVGDVTLFSDIKEMHCFTLTNRYEAGSPRHQLFQWLKNWFCDQEPTFAVRENGGWERAGDFESFVAPRAKPVDTYAAPSAGWPWLERSAMDDILANSHRARTLIGDCVELTKWEGERFQVRVSDAADAVDFRGTFSCVENSDLLTRWLTGFDPTAQRIVTENIEEHSKGSLEQAKVGLVSLDGGALAQGNDQALRIRPVNHLVTTSFNRALAAGRLAHKSFGGPLHQFWASQLKSILGGIQTVEFRCPSQLFLELALVTRDGYVPCTQKHDLNSVYALRNGGKSVWTCGLEVGPRWSSIVRTTADSDIAEIDLTGAAARVLKTEYSLDVDAAATADPFLQVKSLVLQPLHLNTAFIGFWVLPTTRAELEARCKGKSIGGLDHSRIYFIGLGDADRRLADEESKSWHGTAMARFQLLAKFEPQIRDVMARANAQQS